MLQYITFLLIFSIFCAWWIIMLYVTFFYQLLIICSHVVC
jgi:hypothetical protein